MYARGNADAWHPGGVSPRLDARLRRATLVLAVLATIAALVGVNHRAGKGRNALLKWDWAFAALETDGALYGTGPETAERPTSEGYPTLPATLLLLSPYRALGPRWGPVAWAATCAAFAWWIVLAALRLAAGRAGDFPGAGQLLVVAIAGRVLYSELQHGNLNLLVGATVVAGVVAWSREDEFRAGFWWGTGAAWKVTPALAVLWIARTRSLRGLAGFATGLALWVVLIPGLWLGFGRNLELVASWWTQMVAPYLAGSPVTLVQSEHLNQSLLGVLARHLTDAVAIEARPPVHPADVRIGWLDLSPAAFRWVHRGASLLVVALLWRSLPRFRGTVRRGERRADGGASRRADRATLGRGALLALAMLFLSERSWKHHYVLLPLPLAVVAWRALEGRSRAARAALAVAAAAIVGTGDAILGRAGADLAEAWGAYFLAGAALFAAVWGGIPAETDDGSGAGACPREDEGLS